MDKKIWENQYPKMPELFHLAVEQAVNRAVGNETVYNGGETVERGRSDQNIRGAASLNKRKKLASAHSCGGSLRRLDICGGSFRTEACKDNKSGFSGETGTWRKDRS